MSELKKLQAENAALKAQLGMVQNQWNEICVATEEPWNDRMEAHAVSIDAILSTAPEVLVSGSGYIMPHGVGAAKEKQSSFSVSTVRTNKRQLAIDFVIISREESNE